MKARVAWNRLVVEWRDKTGFRDRLRRERAGVTRTQCKGMRYWKLYLGSLVSVTECHGAIYHHGEDKDKNMLSGRRNTCE